MTARKLIKFQVGEFGGKYRIVRVHGGFSVIEKQNGRDWLGVERWKCMQTMDRDKVRSLVVDGVTNDWMRVSHLRDILNALGDELNRLKLSPKRKARKAK